MIVGNSSHGYSYAINRFITYIFVVVLLTPYLNRNASRIFLIALIVSWFLSAVQCRKIPFKSRVYNNCTVFIFVWIAFELIYRIIGFSTADWGNYLMNIISYFSILIAMVVLESDDLRFKRNNTILVLFSLWINALDNIRLSFLFPNATVDINYRWGTDYLKMNIAQTWYYFAVVLGACFVILLLIDEKRMDKRLIEIIALITYIVFLFGVSPRLIACFIFVIAASSIIIIKFARGYKVWYFFALFSLLVFYAIFGKQIMTFIASVIPNERISDRLLDLANINSGTSDENGSVIGRLFAVKTSISTFFSSIQTFMFGVGFHVGDNATIKGIGLHSGIIDMFTKYGILGALFFLNIIKYGVRAVRKIELSNLLNSFQKIFIAAFIIYGLLNQFLAPGIFITFFLLSCNFDLLMNREV